MSASAGYGITHHAVDRYIERVTPSSTRAAARALLEADLREAAPLRERTRSGEERLRLRSGDVAIVKRDPLTRERVVVTVAPQGKEMDGAEEARRMLEWLDESRPGWAATFDRKRAAREMSAWDRASVVEARALAADMAAVVDKLNERERLSKRGRAALVEQIQLAQAGNAKLRARIHNEGWIGPGAVLERVANAVATAALMHMAGFVPEGER